MNDAMAEGISLYDRRQYSAALACFISLSDEISSNADVMYYSGLCCARLERYEEAIEYLEQLITSGTVPARENQCRLVLAVIYSMTNRTGLAEFELKKLLESGYKTSSVFAALAYVAWEQKDSSASVKYYEQALEADAENPTALNGLGYVLACTGRDITRALALCKKASDAVPDSAAFLDSLSWVYFKLGLLDEAKMYIRRAREKDMTNSAEIAEHYKAIHAGIAALRENEKVSQNMSRRGGGGI